MRWTVSLDRVPATCVGGLSGSAIMMEVLFGDLLWRNVIILRMELNENYRHVKNFSIVCDSCDVVQLSLALCENREWFRSCDPDLS